MVVESSSKLYTLTCLEGACGDDDVADDSNIGDLTRED